MRVLLVNANRCRDLLPPPPMGLAYVASAVADAGHDVAILDLLLSRDPEAELRTRLRERPVDLVGLSLRNLDNLVRQRVQAQVATVGGLLRVIRAETKAPVVLGGSAISIAARQALELLGADYAVVGEGEAATPQLIEALLGRRPFADVPGLVRREGAQIVVAPLARCPSFGRSGLERWIDWRRYERAGSTWPIQTRRGCPLPCNYCVYSGIEGRQQRTRPAADVVDEMAAVQAACHPRTFEFVDSTFNVPADHALAVCDEICRRGLRVSLTAQGINPLGVSPELILAMRRAGFRSFMVGAESASDRMLARLAKGFTRADVKRTRDIVRNSGMTSLWFFMLGGPGETRDTVEETMSFIEGELDWPDCAAILFTGVRVLPGTEVERVARAEGQLAADDDLVAPRFYFSPELDERWTLERIREAARRRANVGHAAEENTAVQRQMNVVLPLLGIAPPYWRFLPTVLRAFPIRQLRRLRMDFGEVSEPATRTSGS